MESKNFFRLHELVAEDKVDELRSVLANDPKAKQLLEFKDSSGFTPLLIAAAKGNQAAVRSTFCFRPTTLFFNAPF
jgi:ankyrin repeat protein